MQFFVSCRKREEYKRLTKNEVDVVNHVYDDHRV